MFVNMLRAFSEMDDNMKLKVLIAWKARVVMEKDRKYRSNEYLNAIYSDFCNVIHANPYDISVFKLRIKLIKILNIDKPFFEKVKNFYNNISSKTFGISEIDIDKILISWTSRTKLEKNRKYIYTSESKDIYEHLSNILHGEVEKHDMSYVRECEKKVDEFFKDIKSLHTYKLKSKQNTLFLKNLEKFRSKKVLTNKKARVSNIFFFKSTFNGRRIAFIENDKTEIEKIMNNKFIIIKHNSKDIGTFEFVDRANFYTFLRAKKLKVEHHYQLYY